MASSSAFLTYEQRLSSDLRWALSEGSRHFEDRSAVHETLRKVTARLKDLSISYSVVGGMALFKHGFRRFTEDVDILVTREDLKRIHGELEGRGYVRPFARSKNLRDTQYGVRVEFLITGLFPGDGKPKPVSFPDPRDVSIDFDGINYISLPKLIELKLASGMTSAERIKDLADVQELIKLLDLPEQFGQQLNPYVQTKFQELWKATRSIQKRYVQLWRNKFSTADVESLGEMIDSLREAVETLESMRADGVTLDPGGGTADDYARLVTTDPTVAKKYGMEDEAEFWGLDNEEPSNEESPP